MFFGVTYCVDSSPELEKYIYTCKYQLTACSLFLFAQLFKCSKIQQFKCSKIQQFKCSKIQQFMCSKIQQFKCSKIHYIVLLKQHGDVVLFARFEWAREGRV
jgi:hypothetical protein